MSRSNCVRVVAPRRGLTLLELVVVLGILALLSTVAVQSLEPIADQARYEATQRALDSVHRATAGKNEVSFTANHACGYVADTGSFPSTVNDLLVRPAGISAHAVQTFDSDRNSVNDVNLSSGWKGPYFQLGIGSTSIIDGWGNSLAIQASGGGIAVSSLGSDNDSVAPEDGYRADLTVTIPQSECTGDLVFRLFEIDSFNGSRIDPTPTGTEQLGILFYGVNAAGGTTGAIQEQLLVVSNTGSFELRRSSVPQGLTAARAILWDDLDSDDLLDIGEAIVLKSYVHYPVVRPTMDARVEMELR